ncbi:hypothetical protein BsWGS_12555 [Bradybaena similaris]
MYKSDMHTAVNTAMHGVTDSSQRAMHGVTDSSQRAMHGVTDSSQSSHAWGYRGQTTAGENLYNQSQAETLDDDDEFMQLALFVLADFMSAWLKDECLYCKTVHIAD